jgi:RND family efflux transporter MFP subunit
MTASPRRLPALLRSLACALGIAALLATGCNHSPPPPPPKPIEVEVTTPITDEVTDYQDFTGRLDPLRTNEIRPRVSGYVDAAPFREGDVVKEGDLLFQIDPRSYRADFNQAEANFKQADAERRLQDRNLARGKQLFESRSIGQEELDQITGTWEKATATAAAMQAARDRAKLFLDFTRVTSPVTGRISRRNIDPGNLVNADQTLLTTVVTEDPVYGNFDVDERTYLDLVSTAGPENQTWLSGLQFPVTMRLANEEEFRHAGTVDFIDNRFNGNTGTIRMRGIFPNPKHTLKAGLFVRVRLPIGKPYRPFIIPDEAIQSDQGRKYVFVVNGENRVEYRSVELGQAIHDLRVIKKGLTGGERVIVSGMQRVRAKSEVRVKAQPPPKPPSEARGTSEARATEDRGQRTEKP